MEGRAELLDTTLQRYRSLKLMLGSLTWRRKLIRNESMLIELANAQPQVDEALDHVAYKSMIERWRDSSATLRCAREVKTLQDTLYRQMGRKLKDGKGLTFAERLKTLARQIVAPRRVLPGERWKAAHDALPPRLPELAELARFGDRLETLFKRPYVPSQKTLPFTDVELLELEAQWPQGEAARTSLWTRAAAIDTTRGVVEALTKRSRRAPMKAPKTGPEHLLRTEFWRTLALVRLREVTTAKLSPLQLSDAELLPVARWLAQREKNPYARLEVSGMPPARAGLLTLVAELEGATHENNRERWAVFHDAAERVELALKGDPDLERLRDNLRLAWRVRSSRGNRRPLDPLPPRREEPTGLAELVAELRAMR